MSKKHVLLLLILVLLAGCVDIPDDPQFPRYDIDVHVPVTERSYDLMEVVEKDSNTLRYDVDPGDLSQLYYVDSTITIEKITVEDNLTIDDITSEVDRGMDEIVIFTPDTVSGFIRVEDWTEYQSGDDVVFLDQQGTPTVGMEPFDQFEEVLFKTGYLDLNISNNLPVDVQLRSFQIRNVNDQSVIADTSGIVNIPAESSVQVEFYIGGKTVSNEIEFFGTVRSDGSGGQTVTLPENAGTRMTATIRDGFTVRSARAPLPQQEPFSEDSTFVFDDSTYIRTARIQSGTYQIVINNEFDIDIEMDLTIKNLFDPSGNAYTTSFSLPGGSTVSEPLEPLSLAGYTIGSGTGEPTNELEYVFTARPQSTGDRIILVNLDQQFTSSINMNNLVFERVNGRIKPTDFEIDPTTFDFDLGDLKGKFNYDSLNMSDPEIILLLTNSADVPMNLDAVLTGLNNDGMMHDMNLTNVAIDRNSQTAVSLKDYGLENLLNSFSGSLPDQFNISGNAVINPNYTPNVAVSRDDSISGDVIVEIPLNVGIAGGVIKDTVEIDLGDVDEEDLDNVVYGEVTIELTNEIPMALSMTGYVMDAEGNNVMNIPPPGNDIEAITVESPSVDGEGNVTAAGYKKQVLTMTGDQVKQFLNNDRIYIEVKLETPPEGSAQPVKFRTTDKITFKIYASASYTLDL